MKTLEPSPVSLVASDVSGQKEARVRAVPPDATVGELVDELLESLKLPRNGTRGEPLTYQARLDREGRHVHPTEISGR